MKIAKRFGVVVAMICAMTTSLRADQSTPMAALLTHNEALKAGDKDAARATAKGTEEEYKALDNKAVMAASSKKLIDAFIEAYGEDNPVTPKAKDAPAEAEALEVKEEGDSATIVDKAQPTQIAKLVKKDDKWYIDLTGFPSTDEEKNMVTTAADFAKAVETTVAQIKAGEFGEAQKKVADDIKAGKYDSDEAAATATAEAKKIDAVKAKGALEVLIFQALASKQNQLILPK